MSRGLRTGASITEGAWLSTLACSGQAEAAFVQGLIQSGNVQPVRHHAPSSTVSLATGNPRLVHPAEDSDT